jgi:hypothetical protein
MALGSVVQTYRTDQFGVALDYATQTQGLHHSQPPQYTGEARAIPAQ